MRILALAAIQAYQRLISPYKGFCCAYRHHTGRSSCSSLGYRAIRMYGVISGISILRRRTYLCGVAHRRYSSPHQNRLHPQQGICDLSCDLPGEYPCHTTDICDADVCLDLDPGDCDFPRRRRRTEKYVYIPPSPRRKDEPRQNR